MTTPTYIIALLAAYGIGLSTRALWPVEEAEDRAEASIVGQAEAAAATAPVPPTVGTGQADEKAIGETASGERRVLTLSSEVVSAVLGRGKLEEKLLQMSLTDEQVDAVKEIQEDASVALKEIEKRNAKIVSDESGEYVSIAAFPEERNQWLNQIESDLYDLVGDDRSAIITRMIVFTSTHKEVGIYRRGVAITERSTGPYPHLIEERRFKSDGISSRSTFDVADLEKPERWGQLLNLGAKRERISEFSSPNGA